MVYECTWLCVSRNWGLLAVGFCIVRALPFAVYIRAPDCWKLKRWLKVKKHVVKRAHLKLCEWLRQIVSLSERLSLAIGLKETPTKNGGWQK